MWPFHLEFEKALAMSLDLDWILQDPARVAIFRDYLTNNEASTTNLSRLDFVVEAQQVVSSKSKSNLVEFRSKFVESNDVGYFNDSSLKGQLGEEFRKFADENGGNMAVLLETIKSAREDILTHKLKHCVPTGTEAKKLKKLMLSGKERNFADRLREFFFRFR